MDGGHDAMFLELLQRKKDLNIQTHNIIIHIESIADVEITLTKNLESKMFIEVYGRIIPVYIQLNHCPY